jgi:hypothetical protein
MEYGKAVVYNGGEGNEDLLAFIVGGDEFNADLVVISDSGNAYHTGVPRRDPSEYGAEGGGHTWYEYG